MVYRNPENAYRVISADSHVVEPPDVWTSRVPAKFKERVPRMERFPEGDAWVMEGVPTPVSFGFTVCAGLKPEEMTDWVFIEDVPCGSADPADRVKRLDEDGIDAEVLYPNRPQFSVVANEDAELHHAMIRAYNDWLSEYCSSEPGRLGGVAMLPNRGVDEAVAEFERICSLPGIAAVLLSCYPHGDLEVREEDDRLWRAIEEAGMPLSIHVTLSNQMPFQIKATKLPGTAHFHDAPGRMLQLIFAGVLDRFPDLTIVMTETDCGWTPYFAEQADDNYLRHAKATLKDRPLNMLPSQYMERNFIFTFITDNYALDNRHRIGVDRMMWSNDYPHITSDWPNSWKTINNQFSGVPSEEREKILAGNAQRVFGFGMSEK